ncbi:alkaline phosphatase family protein [bacterium]|nr:alkaline phosphatase family protein [bacterium]
MGVILIFVDGLGMGKTDPEINPCIHPSIQALSFHENSNEHAWNQGYLIKADACLGIKGLPQSASGQTSLLTGINAPQLLGRHLPAFPNNTLREVIKTHSLMKKTREAGFRTVFLNAYRPRFFDLPMEVRWRMSTTTVATLAAGLSFFSTNDLSSGRTLYHDFTNAELVRRGFQLPLFSPEEAASVLADATDSYDFIMYEHFKTDKAGHSQDMNKTLNSLQDLDRFICTVIEKVDLSKHLILLTSDHGNVEDLSTKGHTRNPVPVLTWGLCAEKSADKIKDITDIPQYILSSLVDQMG